MNTTMTKRRFLQAVGAVAGAGAVYRTMEARAAPGLDKAAGCQVLPGALPFPSVANVAAGEEPGRKNGAGNVFCDGFMG